MQYNIIIWYSQLISLIGTHYAHIIVFKCSFQKYHSFRDIYVYSFLYTRDYDSSQVNKQLRNSKYNVLNTDKRDNSEVNIKMKTTRMKYINNRRVEHSKQENMAIQGNNVSCSHSTYMALGSLIIWPLSPSRFNDNKNTHFSLQSH